MREIKLNNGKIVGVDCNDYVSVASIDSACDKSFKFRQYILGAKVKSFIAKIRKEGKIPYTRANAEFSAKSHPLLAIYALQHRSEGFDLLKNPKILELLQNHTLSASNDYFNECIGAFYQNHHNKQRVDLLVKSLPKNLTQKDYKMLADLAISLNNAELAIELFKNNILNLA